MLPPHRPEGFQRLLSYWNLHQNRYKYRDKGYDEMLFRTIKAMYYACISFIDFNLGRILEALGEDINNTIIVYTSDHGEMLGDYGSVGKRTMLNPAARIPLILRAPQLVEPGLSNRPARQPPRHIPDLRCGSGHGYPATFT